MKKQTFDYLVSASIFHNSASNLPGWPIAISVEFSRDTVSYEAPESKSEEAMEFGVSAAYLHLVVSNGSCPIEYWVLGDSVEGDAASAQGTEEQELSVKAEASADALLGAVMEWRRKVLRPIVSFNGPKRVAASDAIISASGKDKSRRLVVQAPGFDSGESEYLFGRALESAACASVLADGDKVPDLRLELEVPSNAITLSVGRGLKHRKNKQVLAMRALEKHLAGKRMLLSKLKCGSEDDG